MQLLLITHVKNVLKVNIRIYCFILAMIWAICSALSMNRAYQDSWVLEGVTIQMFVLFFAYSVAIYRQLNLSHFTILTAAMSFLISSIPAMKYSTIYNSTVDTAVHVSSVYTIVSTGHADPLSAYVNTPGFHSLLASLAQLSGTGIEIWLKIIPSFLGSMIPFAYYMLVKRISLPVSLAKITIFLSGLSLPLFYIIEGTGFTLPIFSFIIIIFFIRESGVKSVQSRIPYTIILLLFVAGMIMWHPSTSLVAPMIFIVCGMISEVDRSNNIFLPRMRLIISLGFLIIISTLCYWMYSADYVWSKFAKNIILAINPYNTPNLIPRRLFDINFIDQLIIALTYHARDMLLIALSFLGLLAFLRLKISDDLTRFYRTFSLLWVASIMPVFLIFASGFGAQGYKRFLSYVIILSPILAAFGLWKAIHKLHGYFPRISRNLLIYVALFVLGLLSSIQIYPYQPALPVIISNVPKMESTPILWMHQVNTQYQYYMLDYAFNRIPREQQIIADYISFQQSALYFNLQAKNRIHQINTVKSEPAYVLLHWPGRAGGYVEQAEYRFTSAINNIRMLSDVNTIYDNGESFVLYSRNNNQQLSFLRSWK